MKLVAEVGRRHRRRRRVSKAKADVVLISGHDGGTGASAADVAEARRRAVGARPRRDPADAAAQRSARPHRRAGRRAAEDRARRRRSPRCSAPRSSASPPRRSSSAGCVMMRVCHLDTCPVGVATQNPELRERFSGKPEFVVNFFEFIAEEVREHMAALGFRTIAEMIGHVEVLDTTAGDRPLEGARASTSARSSPRRRTRTARRCTSRVAQDHGLDAGARPAADRARRAGARATASRSSSSCRSATSTAPSARCSATRSPRRYGGDGPARRHDRHPLPRLGRAELRRVRAARASRCASKATPTTTSARGCRAGAIVVRPTADAAVRRRGATSSPATSSRYGATGGEIFLRGVVGERFCVRNSGATAVVEGVGDHGCEYMTGGRCRRARADRPQLRRRDERRASPTSTTRTRRSARWSTARWSSCRR